MKVKVTITGQLDEQHYPLSTLTDMLYTLIDDLLKIERQHDVDVPYPLKRQIRERDSEIEVKLSEVDA